MLLALVLSSCACKHNYSDWKETKAPTCKDYGKGERICVKCGESEIKWLTPITSHTFGEWKTSKKPTCVNVGVERRICSVCEKTDERGLPIDINAHSFGEWETTVAPTYESDGERVRECELCKTSQIDIIEKLH